MKNKTHAQVSEEKDHDDIVRRVGGHVKCGEGNLTSNLYLFRKNKKNPRQAISENVTIVWAK